MGEGEFPHLQLATRNSQSEALMETFPAIFIGGPPHSGKSVLTYSLTQELRRRKVEHYVLRACPDGEGDWANEAAQQVVRTIRVKGAFTREFVENICRDLANRHLPLLVDVGGRPTPEQEVIFSYCTHCILLTKDEASRAEWLDLAERHAIIVIADITSALEGESYIIERGPVLRGVITGLHRGTTARGPVFDALVEKVASIFDYDREELRRMHYALSPVENIIDLDRLAGYFGLPDYGARWEPHHLQRVFDELPFQSPMALYGRGPNWLYAAIAVRLHPQPLYQFDVRLGWVKPPALTWGLPSERSPVQVEIVKRPDHTRLEFKLTRAYIDYRTEASQVRIPLLPFDQGIVLSGKLPLWLWTALALAYKDALWLAVYQPQWKDKALVITSRADEPIVGDYVISPPVSITPNPTRV
ncbi:MAG TPA: hypothetical protein ENG33_08165 [Chloroflexi bacterium]|nr:hypothetical protein [Chloroflexota bacterium]